MHSTSAIVLPFPSVTLRYCIMRMSDVLDHPVGASHRPTAVTKFRGNPCREMLYTHRGFATSDRNRCLYWRPRYEIAPCSRSIHVGSQWLWLTWGACFIWVSHAHPKGAGLHWPQFFVTRSPTYTHRFDLQQPNSAWEGRVCRGSVTCPVTGDGSQRPQNFLGPPNSYTNTVWPTVTKFRMVTRVRDACV